MQKNKLINFKKKLVLKRIKNTPKNEDLLKRENESNSNELNPWCNFTEPPKNEELILKNVELYEPISFEELVNLNKKKYRNLKIENLKIILENALYNLKNSIELYKELINRTEFWEKRTTYDFNFDDWNTLKKANGKLTRYYNDIKRIYQKIETEEL